MAKEMLINVSAGEECRIALLDNNKLEELYMERTSSTSHVGNIYKGKVTNVEPSIQAAFVDFGIGRNGFLHISDLMPSYFGKKADNYSEPVGRKLSRRDRPPIQQCLRKGDEIIVQIIKEGIGTKGPTLSTYLSIPGRVLVMMPGMSKMGISKKIEDEEERARLRKILDGLKPPKDCGFIIRTAGIGKSKLEIERDLKYLARLWEQLKKKIDKEKPPVELYTEGDLVTRTVRDVFTSDIDAIIVDEKDTAKKVKDFIKLAMPRTKNKVQEYSETLPLFHKYDIEGEIEKIYSRRVPLPSGGYLIIDQTEAVVAIDVNSGKFRDHSDAETTAFKTDLEAADEIPRQLKLRDMGGVIICDFIDLRFERHRREVEQKLHDNLKNDRAKTRMLRMSQFGIIEMTRQRMRPSLKKSIYQECAACSAHGMVKTPESMSLDVTRKLRIALADQAVVRVQLTAHPEVANYLLNKKRSELFKLEDDNSKKVLILSDASLPMDQMKFELFDARDGFIYIAELGMSLPTISHQHHGKQSGRNRDQNRDRQHHKPKHDRRDEEVESLDADELFSDETDDQPKKESKKSQPKDAGEEESSVVDIEDGGTEAPGSAPGVFNENGDNDDRYRNRDRDGGNRNRNRRRRGRRGRGGRDRDDRNGDQPSHHRGQTQGGHGGGHSHQQRPASKPLTAESAYEDVQHDDADENAPGNTVEGDAHNAPSTSNRGGQQQRYGQHRNDRNDRNNDRGGDRGGDRRDRNDDQQGGGRRRRGRRGGRNRRGGGGGPESKKPQFDYTGLPNDEELDREAEELEARHRAQRASQSATTAAAKPQSRESNFAADERGTDSSSESSQPTSRQQSAPKRVPPVVNVVKTGSTDKHLADDIPVDHEPVRRPRSRRDLDELPDFDDD